MLPVLDLLNIEFPNLQQLDIWFYTNEPYKSQGFRRNKIFILWNTMLKCSEFVTLDKNLQFDITKKIEAGCLRNVWIKTKEANMQCSWQSDLFSKVYHCIIYEKCEELNIEHNKFLLKEILEEKIDPSLVANLDGIDENPDFYRLLRERTELRKNQKIEIKTTKLYECPHCQQKMATLQEVQIRSSDEGKDIKLNCVFCEWEWYIIK